jgi:tryptophan synthase beta chain
MGLKAVIFMHSEQMQIQRSNVFRMQLSGADVQEVDMKKRVGGDIRTAAFDHWARFTNDTFLVMGLDAGPHPYPMMMLEFTSLIGRECRRQIHAHIKKAPDIVVARAGENADAIGLFPAFLKALGTRLVCVGATDSFAGVDIATSNPKNLGVFNPSQPSLTMQEGKQAARIMEGLDYPSVARETRWLKASGRVEFVKTKSSAAKKAIHDLSRCEGIIPAIETAYALAWAFEAAASMSRDQTIVVYLGENVEKDIWEIGKAMGTPV